MPNKKQLTNIMNHPLTKVAGVAATALRPNPVMLGADFISRATTGKSIQQNLIDSVQGPATGTGNVGRNRKGKTLQEGPSNPTPKQKSKKEMRVGQYSHGGLVSHKSVGACEKSMGKRKR